MNTTTENGKSSADKIRVGIIGAGLMGEWHARAAEKSGGKIVGVSDIDIRRAQRLSANYQGAESFGNATSMLARKSIDVIHICAPTGAHRVIAELAIAANVNLIIEKPLALSADETILLYKMAAKKNVLLCPAHQFAFQPGVEKAKNLMPRIGRIIHLQANICSAGGGDSSDDGLSLTAADILPHPLSLFQTFLNERLAEDDWEIFQPRGGELRIYGRAQTISLSIFVSMNSRPTVNSFQICGMEGTIHLDLFHGFALMETGTVSMARKILRPFNLSIKSLSVAAINLARRTIRNEKAYPGLRQLTGSFYRSIKEGTPSPITPEQAINVARIRDYLIQRAGIG